METMFFFREELSSNDSIKSAKKMDKLSIRFIGIAEARYILISTISHFICNIVQ